MTIIGPFGPILPLTPHVPPITTSSPFSYRSAGSYQEQVEELRRHVNDTFSTVDGQFGEIVDAINTTLDEQSTNVDGVITDLTDAVNAAIASVIGSSVEVQDPVVAGLLADIDSATREALDALYVKTTESDANIAAKIADDDSATRDALDAWITTEAQVDGPVSEVIADEDSDTRVVLDGRYSTLADVTSRLAAERDITDAEHPKYWDRDKIVVLGDSIVVGDQDGSGVSYPALMNTALPDAQVIGIGRSGWASADIAGLWGVPFVLAGFNLIAGVGPNTVTLRGPVGGFRTAADIFPQWTGELRLPDGTVIPGTLRHTIDPGATVPGAWLFNRTEAGDAVVVPEGSTFVCTQYDAHKNATLIIAVGRNNNVATPEIAARDITAIIAAHGSPKSVIVLPITYKQSETTETTAFYQVKAANDIIRRTFPELFYDHASYMMLNGPALNGVIPSLADFTAVVLGTAPGSVMNDDTHPNQRGYRAIADGLIRTLSERGLYGRANAVAGVVNGWKPMLWRAADLRGPVQSKVVSWRDRLGGVTLTASSNPPTIGQENGGEKFVRFNEGSTNDNRLNLLSIADLPEAFLVIAKLKLRVLGQINPIIWSDTTGEQLIFNAANVLQMDATAAGAAIAAETTVWVHALFNGNGSFMKYDGISTQPVAKGNTNGFKGSIRVGHSNDGTNRWSKLDLFELAIIPGVFDSTTAYQMVSLLRDRTI